MTTNTETTTDDEQDMNDWHTLPAMIGDAIIDNVDEIRVSGNWCVEVDDGDVVISRILERAGSKDDLVVDGDTRAIWDSYVTVEHYATLPEPPAGWDAEIEPLPEDIFEGFE